MAGSCGAGVPPLAPGNEVSEPVNELPRRVGIEGIEGPLTGSGSWPTLMVRRWLVGEAARGSHGTESRSSRQATSCPASVVALGRHRCCCGRDLGARPERDGAVPDLRVLPARRSDTVAVMVGVAPCSWTRPTGVAETATSISIRVETLPCPLPLAGTDQLDLRELMVSVPVGVGDRAITDAQGQSIPMRAP